MAEYLNESNVAVDADEKGNTKWLSIKAGGRSSFSEIELQAPINLNRLFTYNASVVDGTSIILKNNIVPSDSINALYNSIVPDLTVWTIECNSPEIPTSAPEGFIRALGADRNVIVYWSVRCTLDTDDVRQLNYWNHTVTCGVQLAGIAPIDWNDPVNDPNQRLTKQVNILRNEGSVKFAGYFRIEPLHSSRKFRICLNNVATAISTTGTPPAVAKIVVKDAQLI